MPNHLEDINISGRNLVRSSKNLDRFLIHPPIKHKFRPSNAHIFWVEIHRFLSAPGTDDLLWQLWKKFVLNKK